MTLREVPRVAKSRENDLLRYFLGLLSLTISEAQPRLLWWKLIVDNCSIQDGCKQTNRFQGNSHFSFYRGLKLKFPSLRNSAK